jgi:2-isopropylmalate synthase
MRILTFDTTLRDGTQGEGICFSSSEKLLIAQKLDELGIDFIEGGWPGSNPKDREFFTRANELHLKNARLVAFGSTRLARFSVNDDPSVQALVSAGTPTVAIFGKSWDLHVQRALEISEEENLRIISDTVRYLKAHGKEVIYDAEHFFDGYAANSAFALSTIEAAKSAGADVIVLCDTNGGTITSRLAAVCAAVRERVDGVLGIHTHNDSDLAVANTLAAVECGFTHVQGCMNGYGERCGNANMVTVIANLELKMGHTTIGPEKLVDLTSVARFVSDLANLPMRGDQSYVGKSAFAHKAGVHVSAVLKDPRTYEHVSPQSVGNRQRVLISELSGRGTIGYKLNEHGLDRLDDPARRKLLDQVKHLENQGYELEAAEGTFELMVRQAQHPDIHLFDALSYQVVSEPVGSTATVTVKVKESKYSATAEGKCPVYALNLALRRCLSKLYPPVGEVQLTDYRIRVLDFKRGAAARVRVLIEWADHPKRWATMGVSEDVIEASWLALVDALRLELMRLTSPMVSEAFLRV